MIARPHSRKKKRLSATTINTFRSLARRGTNQELEDFLLDVCMRYMSEITDADFVDPRDYLKVVDTKFECECPYCNEMIELDLAELTK